MCSIKAKKEEEEGTQSNLFYDFLVINAYFKGNYID